MIRTMYHSPVLLDESIESLEINENGVYVDLTFGGGGHSKEILKRLSRGGKLIAIVTEGDTEVKSIADHCIEIPKCFREITPLLTIIPLQLLSYHIALMRNCNVDQPRN